MSARQVSKPGRRPLIVLGSRSPRRRDLLSLLLPDGEIEVRPPLDPNELGFDGLSDRSSIEQRLLEITRDKSADVLERTTEKHVCVVTADTVVIVETADGQQVLGQPPEHDRWAETVRHWFRDHLLGRTHVVATAIRVAKRPGAESIGSGSVEDADAWECVVKTCVTFADADESLVEWYLATGEPCGKAGGYALQGAGAIFVERVEGSPTNVVGLPLRETRDLLITAGVVEA